MNKENVLRVAEALESLDVNGNPIPGLGFNMSEFVSIHPDRKDKSKHNCGTTACIAGWTVAVLEEKGPKDLCDFGATEVEYEARALLDLDPDTAHDLFYAHMGCGRGLEAIPLSSAISVLKHLAETGDVDWAQFTSPDASPDTGAATNNNEEEDSDDAE